MQKISARFPGKKILLVEDYFINQEIVQDMLELMECTVDIAEDGAEAIKKFDAKSYDLILMDIQLPEKDGYEVTRTIRTREQTEDKKPVTIVALTANAMVGDKEKCIEAGMNDYIAKPIELAILESVLKKYLPA
ncbi:MAG: response regulator [Chlamydiales bacterium]|nr:response regulator [Chlamydiales bacterium]